jgi:hypothetical protein
MYIVQTQGFLLDMIRDVRAGRLAPAAFQRPYVWGKDDVESLWSSLIERWPIGSFLIWVPAEPAAGAGTMSPLSRGRLGPLPALPEARGGLILDGQNRLASLAWAMFGDLGMPQDASVDERATWDPSQRLIADYPTRTIRFVPTAEANLGCRMPAGALCDSTLLHNWLRKDAERYLAEDGAIDWFDDCASAVRSARITTTILENATPEEAKRAFLRIAKAGVAMSEADFDAALGWTAPVSIDLP